jgi:hypothetical protein
VKSIIDVLGDGHREAVIKCLFIWRTIELLKRFPDDEATRAPGDSCVRAMWGSRNAALLPADPTHFAEAHKGARTFWGVSSITSRCIRKREVSSAQMDGENGDQPTHDSEATTHDAPAAVAPPEDGAHLRQLAMDLFASYVQALETSPSNLTSENGRRFIRDCSLVQDARSSQRLARRIFGAWNTVPTSVVCSSKCGSTSSGWRSRIPRYTGHSRTTARRRRSSTREYWMRFPRKREGLGLPMQSRTSNGSVEMTASSTIEWSTPETPSLKARRQNNGRGMRLARPVPSHISDRKRDSAFRVVVCRETHAMERCMNVLHGGHLIPSLSLDAGGNVELASSWVDQLDALIQISLRILGTDEVAPSRMAVLVTTGAAAGMCATSRWRLVSLPSRQSAKKRISPNHSSCAWTASCHRTNRTACLVPRSDRTSTGHSRSGKSSRTQSARCNTPVATSGDLKTRPFRTWPSSGPDAWLEGGTALDQARTGI